MHHLFRLSQQFSDVFSMVQGYPMWPHTNLSSGKSNATSSIQGKGRPGSEGQSGPVWPTCRHIGMFCSTHSANTGATTCPVASMDSFPEIYSLVIVVIQPFDIPTLAKASNPVSGSIIRPLRITTSYSSAWAKEVKPSKPDNNTIINLIFISFSNCLTNPSQSIKQSFKVLYNLVE